MATTGEFQVRLDDIRLSPAAKQRIQLGIQQLVLQELAQIDHKGDVVIGRPVKLGPIWNGIIARLAAGKIQINSVNTNITPQ